MKTENLIKQALDALDQYQLRRYPQHLFDARMALYKALETIYKVEDPLGDIQYLKDPFHDSEYLRSKND